MLRIFADLTNRIVIIAILVMGVSIGIARLLLPIVSDYRAEIEEAASEAIGRKVSIESLHARWHGFSPQLILKNIQLSAERGNTPPLHLEEIRVGIGLFDSIINAKPIPTNVELANAHIRLRKLPNGSIKLLGINDLDLGTSNGDEEFDLTKLPVGIGLLNSEITLETPRFREPLRLYNLNLRLRQDDNRYLMKARLQIGGHTANQVTAAADLSGNLADPNGWDGHFYLSGEALALDTLLKHFLPSDFKQLSGLTEFELWGQIRSGTLQRLEGDLSLQGLTVKRTLATGDSSYGINRLQSRFRWHGGHDGWRAELTDLQIKRDNTQWPKTSLTLQAWQKGEDVERIEGHIGFLRLQDILSAVKIMPAADHGMLQVLQNLQPAGDLRNLSFVLDTGGNEVLWEVAGTMERIRAKAWGNLPGISNVSATFQANHNGGIASIDSSNILLHFKNDLFRNSMRLKQLHGPMQWSRKGDAWEVSTYQFEVTTPDFTTHSRAVLTLPDKGEAHLDLQTDLRNVDVAYVRNYLPVGVMYIRVVEWLDHSLVSGNIETGTVLFRGPVNDFPFDTKPSGRFEVVLNVEDVILDYQEGWPRLERASAELRFLNNSFEGIIHQAEISASVVERAVAKIDVLDPASPLKLNGVVTGPLSDELRLLRDSPLSKKFGEMATGIVGKGDTRLTLELSETLDSDDPTPSSINGKVHFSNNSLEIDKWDIDLHEINGILEFNKSKVWAKGIKTRVMGSLMKLDVLSPQKGPRRTEIRATGPFKVKTLADKYLDLRIPHIQGRTDWNLLIDIPHSTRRPQAPVNLVVSSMLKGVAIDLPAPLGKNAKTEQPLRISLNPDKDNKAMPVNIRIGDQADVYLSMRKKGKDKREMERAEIRFGGKRATYPKSPGLHFSGALSRFKLDPWIEMFGQGENSTPFKLSHVDVHFGRFEYKDLVLNDISIDGRSTQNGWRGAVTSPQIKGLINLPKSLKEAIRLDLDHYTVTSLSTSATTGPGKPNTFDPRQLPPIQVNSKKLIFNGQNLGALTLSAQKTSEGLRFDTIRVMSDWFKLNAQGWWFAGKKLPKSSIMLKAETKNTGKLMQALAFAANIKKAPGRIEGNLTWPGDPTNIEDLNISGNLDFHLGKGSFVDIDPGAGRIFGLFNLGALQRRLTLDFSDFFGKGFGFDEIEGQFTLDNGDAYTNNLAIEAPTGIITFSGRTGLTSRDFDQLVTVIPDVTGTLATAGALAAGPVVGAALFITNKILGKQLNKVSKTQYQVNGPWDNPKISAIKPEGSKASGYQEGSNKGFNLDNL